MEYPAIKVHRITLLITALLLYFNIQPFSSAYGDSTLLEDNPPRLEPLPIAVSLAEMIEPLPLDLLAGAALEFSGLPGSTADLYQAVIEDLFAQVAAVVSGSDDPAVRAEKVLLFMQEHLLRVYDVRQTRVDILLEEGSFNCVSSAVLYLLLCRSIGMKVWAVRTADHAFCRVQAGKAAYDVETTSPAGFDPGSKKEFKDEFGKVTGFSYVSPANYSGRQEVDERGLLALILFNRVAFLSEEREYGAALGPAVDAYALLGDEESYDRLIVAFSNLASWYGLHGDYRQGVELIGQAADAVSHNSTLVKVKSDLLHNWVIDLAENKELETAASLLTDKRYRDSLEGDEWKTLSIYIYQLQAREAAVTSFGRAAHIIKSAVTSVGADPELLRSYEHYVHNHFVEFFNKQRFNEANRVIDQGLGFMPRSNLLLKDQALLAENLD
jgi:tetratricopeptide (TPR) repeat protein